MFSRIPEWLRSAILTFAFTFLVAISASDFAWDKSALAAAAVAALRTAASAIIPGGSFGPGSGGDSGDEG